MPYTDLEKKRESNRLRQKRYRKKKKGVIAGAKGVIISGEGVISKPEIITPRKPKSDWQLWLESDIPDEPNFLGRR